MDDRDDASDTPASADQGTPPAGQDGIVRQPNASPDDSPAGGPDGASAESLVDDFDAFNAAADAEWARMCAALEAGTEPVPPEPKDGGMGISLSLGGACDLDPALLALIAGPDGLGGQGLGPAFGQGESADVLRPSPVLNALTEQAAARVGRLSGDERAGVLQALRRQANRNAYQQTVVIADFARDQAAQCEEAKARKVPPGRRAGEFPAEELAIELVASGNYADRRIEYDLALTSRLPLTLAGMADGLIDADRADIIARCTSTLSDADAAHADAVLAPVAPSLRYEQLARKAAALEMKLNPDAVKARKEHAKQLRRRVEVRREDSGNASIAARELDTADALACKAYVDATAVRLRNSGLVEGTLPHIRALVLTELLQGRAPLNLIKPRPRIKPRVPAAPDPAAPAAADPAVDGPGADGEAGFRDPDDPGPDEPGDPNEFDRSDDWDELGDFCDPDAFDDPGAPIPEYNGPGGAPPWTPGEAELARQDHTDDRLDIDDLLPRRGPLRPGESAPPPANINLIIPIGTLLGLSTAPAHAGGFGLLDPEETQSLVAAASRHPRTRWSATITDPSGRAIAHGRARGQHPWNPPPPASSPPTSPPGPGPDADWAAQLRHLTAALGIIFDPIAQADCDHRHAENRYTPSRKLRDLLRARSATCDAPGCNAQAIHCDQDHTVPYPKGPTCECNLGPKCRRHHRAKQAPGWRIERPEPGIARWTLPSGRTHISRPTTYDI